ncbi:MAG: hypothetical protein MUF87_05735 [Anaerolineae bacterium]|jgi:hypothetical protein|nr:hypothetical protein [Anaerolineae bacterium]
MPNEKHLRLMQEALDGELSPEGQQLLTTLLRTDGQSALEYDKLQRVETLLNSAPHERAPRRLAATIMARVAAQMEAQTWVETAAQTKSDPMVEMSKEVIALSVLAVTVVTMPLLISASWMVINAMADPSLLTMVLQQVVGMMLLMLNMMLVFLEKAQSLIESDPLTAAALMSLIPVTLLSLVRYMFVEQA